MSKVPSRLNKTSSLLLRHLIIAQIGLTEPHGPSVPLIIPKATLQRPVHRSLHQSRTFYHRKPSKMTEQDYGVDTASINMAHMELEDRASSGGKRGNDGGRRRGGGRRGGGGGGGQGREVQVSKALSKLLRHQAASAGIQLDDEGFAPLDRVLQWGPLKSLKVSFSEIQSIVTDNDKQRFSLKPNPATNPSLSTESTSPSDYLIRANQGHSIKLDSSALLEPITAEAGNVPEKVLHGTYYAFWPTIVSSGGLKPMGRNHVHCSTGTPEEGVVSGMRRDAELLIEIDVERSIKEGGLQWWKSENGVVLTEGGTEGVVSTNFFKRVTGRLKDVGVLWEEGEKVADLPEGLKARPPPGKGPRGSGRGGRRDGQQGS